MPQKIKHSGTETAGLAERKRRDILRSSREHFLRDGFTEASMDAIAKSAGVSVKTIYSHFANKEELFTRVMIGACNDPAFAGEAFSEAALRQRFGWFSQGTRRGLREAGEAYLQHLLSEDQLALYRVLTRDSGRFPELSRQYRQVIAQGRTGILTAYLKGVTRQKGWVGRNAAHDAENYEGLLRADIFEAALLSLRKVSAAGITERAKHASSVMWKLLNG